LIQVFPNFITKKDSSVLLKNIFDIEPLWENRQDLESRKLKYRNGDWYTIGTPSYLDLNYSEINIQAYAEKVKYFNGVLFDLYSEYVIDLPASLGLTNAVPLCFLYPLASMFGIHLFPSRQGAQYFLGKIHQDLQWELLFKLPDFPFKKEDVSKHFSFTIPLLLPYMGGGLNLERERYEYAERALYYHDTGIAHAIAEFKEPILPSDWRITLQGHGFTVGANSYLYW